MKDLKDEEAPLEKEVEQNSEQPDESDGNMMATNGKQLRHKSGC